MSIRVGHIPGTDLLVEFVEHLGTVNLARRGSPDVFTMSRDEWSELCGYLPRVRGRAQMVSDRPFYERTMPRAVVAGPRFDVHGHLL